MQVCIMTFRLTRNREMAMQQFKNSYLKVERAEEILNEIIGKIDSEPPYSYILETDTSTHQRATLARRNDISLDKLVIRCGELFHNLRSAIDQAYFEAISPNVETDKHKAIQFPISKDAESYEQTIKSRLGNKAGEKFYNSLKSLNAFYGEGGNFSLVLLHEINVGDKHKVPTPTGNFSKIDSSVLKQYIPDFPQGFTNCGAGMSRKDVVWTFRFYNPKDIGDLVPPFMHVYQKVIEAPVETWFYINSPPYNGKIVPTLQVLIAETRASLDVMRNGMLAPIEN